MRSSIRRIVILLLVTAILMPGILQARTPQASWNRVSDSSPQGFFMTVWNWLSSFWGMDPAGQAKNGGTLDPSGSTPPPPPPIGTTTTTSTSDGTSGGDNGGTLDPSGKP